MTTPPSAPAGAVGAFAGLALGLVLGGFGVAAIILLGPKVLHLAQVGYRPGTTTFACDQASVVATMYVEGGSSVLVAVTVYDPQDRDWDVSAPEQRTVIKIDPTESSGGVVLAMGDLDDLVSTDLMVRPHGATDSCTHEVALR